MGTVEEDQKNQDPAIELSIEQQPEQADVDPLKDYDGRKVALAILVTIIGAIIGIMLGGYIVKLLGAGCSGVTASAMFGGAMIGASTWIMLHKVCGNDLENFTNSCYYDNQKYDLKLEIENLNLRKARLKQELERTKTDFIYTTDWSISELENSVTCLNYRINECKEEIKQKKKELDSLEKWRKSLTREHNKKIEQERKKLGESVLVDDPKANKPVGVVQFEGQDRENSSEIVVMNP